MERRLPLKKGAVRLAALIALALLAPLGAATTSVAPHIVAAPGAWLTQYATPATVTDADLGVYFRNEDIMRHDVVSDAYGPDGAPWCLDMPEGFCPLFSTPLIGRGVTARVAGLENAEPGVAYGYFCTLHAAMRGTLVLAAPTT